MKRSTSTIIRPSRPVDLVSCFLDVGTGTRMRRMSLVLCIHLDGDTNFPSRTGIGGTRDEKLLSLRFDFKLLSWMDPGWDGDIKELGPGFRFG
mmetsp:Transcript_40942/g.46188  ORF Transcript_40942/g.46188 Transcript_40942/m.46188 type:complete len:93 (-) Transcript_40942:2326-2604(-)